MVDTQEVALRVRAAEKRDASRGVARLPSAAMRSLSVLSGDTVVIRGQNATVAKVWPAGASIPADAIQCDADTRANADVRIGDTVQVEKVEVVAASQVALTARTPLSDTELDEITTAVRRDLRNRPVRSGDRIRVAGLGVGPFDVTETRPDGTVRITDSTVIDVDAPTPETAESSKPREQQVATPDEVSYEDIGGLDDELEQIREMIELPLSEPALFRRLGIDPPKGVLLHGPPGTGKTLIAKAVANEVQASFFTVSGPEIMSKYKGESEERLREKFDTARDNAPAILFFDEIDAIAGERDESSDVENRVVAQLLSMMDGLESRGQVVVIGATNRVDSLDPALRRGGRFDREIEIGVPGVSGRREILEVHTRGMPLADDVDVDRIAERTHGFVGADLKALVTEAAMHALRRARRADSDELVVNRDDVESALSTVDPSAMRAYVAEKPQTGFENVGGLDDAKATLREAIEWPLSYGPLFEAANTSPPSGVLLYGPPGTGKTLLARAIAAETEVNFIRVAGPELIDRYVGESEKAVREVFERARHAAPAIVFFDEIDAIASRRDDAHEVTERVVSQLLTELDGVVDNPQLVVLAATNRKGAIDSALLRPGRLELHVEVPRPDEPARRAILEVHARGKPLADDVDLDALAADLERFSGADVEALCRAAALSAIRRVTAEYPTDANEHGDEVALTGADFEAAAESITPTID